MDGCDPRGAPFLATPTIANVPAATAITQHIIRKMSIFPTTVEGLTRWNGIFSGLYIAGLVVGAVSSAGIIYCGSRLQSAANLRIAETNKRAAELEKENLEIKRKMAWRSLSGDERKAFIDSVRGSGHQVTVVELEDGEAWNYAENLFSALREAGWAAGKNYRRPYDSGGVPQGVVCRISKNPDAMVQIVVKALEKAGANPTIEYGNQLRPEFIEITVGLRSIK
jgi:hypothetical protein